MMAWSIAKSSAVKIEVVEGSLFLMTVLSAITAQPTPSESFDPSVKMKESAEWLFMCDKKLLLSKASELVFLSSRGGQIVVGGQYQGGDLGGCIAAMVEGSSPTSLALSNNLNSNGLGRARLPTALSTGSFTNLLFGFPVEVKILAKYRRLCSSLRRYSGGIPESTYIGMPLYKS